ncbi:M23 family metallopeptidase [Microbacterium sp. No. 7]|uniref:M23 family metallopeptidase n=1 Tax=Microbacterium sp. No. 7 TaxID=1714373 RepID=UPI0006D1C1AB|nr:M23 family metallopeptidase [Microbacterium sp. No. 7]ALJ19668.1 hypothetical protein AOA12_07000 [Microbacterium sp. No. 7]
MAEQLDPSKTPEVFTTAPTNLTRRTAPTRRSTQRRRPRALRNVVTLAAVTGMVATVAIPLISVTRGAEAEALTLQQVAIQNKQSLVVASDETPEALDRGTYSATTPEEIQAKKDEEAAQAALAARLAAAAASASSSSSSSSGSGYTAQSFPTSIASSGQVVHPVPGFSNFGDPYGGHKGTDFMAPYGTPIYAMADGVVVTSVEGGTTWGVYIKIAHNIGGQSVTSLYAHMAYGSRAVFEGETVTAGQYIGQVSDTGLAFGTHLHLEIAVDGVLVSGNGGAADWIAANAR